MTQQTNKWSTSQQYDFDELTKGSDPSEIALAARLYTDKVSRSRLAVLPEKRIKKVKKHV